MKWQRDSIIHSAHGEKSFLFKCNVYPGLVIWGQKVLRVNRKLAMGHNIWLMWLMPKEIVSNEKQHEKSVFFARYILMNGWRICQLLRRLTVKWHLEAQFLLLIIQFVVRSLQRLLLGPNRSRCHGQKRGPPLCGSGQRGWTRGAGAHCSPLPGCGPQDSGCDLVPASLSLCLILCAVPSWPKIAAPDIDCI